MRLGRESQFLLTTGASIFFLLVCICVPSVVEWRVRALFDSNPTVLLSADRASVNAHCSYPTRALLGRRLLGALALRDDSFVSAAVTPTRHASDEGRGGGRLRLSDSTGCHERSAAIRVRGSDVFGVDGSIHIVVGCELRENAKKSMSESQGSCSVEDSLV
jgi:hypothetical protein